MRILNDLALKNKTAYPKLSLGGGFFNGIVGIFFRRFDDFWDKLMVRHAHQVEPMCLAQA